MMDRYVLVKTLRFVVPALFSMSFRAFGLGNRGTKYVVGGFPFFIVYVRAAPLTLIPLMGYENYRKIAALVMGLGNLVVFYFSSDSFLKTLFLHLVQIFAEEDRAYAAEELWGSEMDSFGSSVGEMGTYAATPDYGKEQLQAARALQAERPSLPYALRVTMERRIGWVMLRFPLVRGRDTELTLSMTKINRQFGKWQKRIYFGRTIKQKTEVLP